MKYSFWKLLITYYLCGWISTLAGYLYDFPSEFPDEVLSAMFLMPFVNFVLMLSSIVGFFINLDLHSFILFMSSVSLCLGSVLYVIKKKQIYLAFVAVGSLIINIHTQKLFWAMMSV